MAEVVGLVASVIQVAGAGLKLSQTLYQYADGVATADRRVKDIAKEIELTSFVIEDLGAIFNQEENATIISNNAIRTANETMKECSTVFAEISATLKKSKKNTFGRLMLPFRDPKIQLLRDHIDKLKSTLTLLMQVLSHAHLVKSNKLGKEAIARQREEIKTLLEQKKMTTKKYEESLKNYSGSEDGTLVDDDLTSNRELDQESSPNTLGILSADSTINLDSLGKCVNHIRNLLENIETLQQALTNQVDGDDNSEHHQSLIGSYFKTRSHLDEVLFGSSRSSTVRASMRGIQIGIEKSLTGITHRSQITLTNTVQLAEDAGAQPSTEDIQCLKRVVEALRVEKDAVKLEAERKLHEYETLLKASQLKLEIELDKSNKAEEARKLEIKRQPPIKFQDTLGRIYVLPFQACKTWQGMHTMIKQVYPQDSKWQRQISDERYHLMDADGNILLPTFWEFLVEPGSMITMVFLPTTPVDDQNDKSKIDLSLTLPKDDTETVEVAEPVSRKEAPPEEAHDAGQVVEDIDRPTQGEDHLPGSSNDMDVDLDVDSLDLVGIDVPDEATIPRSRRHRPANYHGGGIDPNTLLSEPKQLIMSRCGGGGFNPNSSSSKPNSDVKTDHPDVDVPDITIKLVDPSPSRAKRLEEIQAEIEATIPIMRDNIHRVSERGARLDSLNDKTDTLAVSAQGFRRGANRQRSSGLWDSVYNWFSAPAIPSLASDTSNDAGDGTWNWSFGGFGNDRKRLEVQRRPLYGAQSEIVSFERRFVPSSSPVDEVDEILREWTTVLEE